MIKFRAWVKTQKRMIETDHLFDIHYKYEMITVKQDDRDLEGFAFDEIELMQSTGLKDKNGKEIFEGDIVLVLDSPYTVFYDNEKGSYRLKPHDDRWNVDYMSNFSHGGNFEVVSNIYENKEQL